MSAYAARMQRERDAYMQTAERITRQFDMDTLHIALSRYEKLSLGYQRIMEINDLWAGVRAEYKDALLPGDEADVARHHLDAELLQIAKDEGLVIPFEDRYPELKRIKYDGRGPKRGTSAM